MKKLVVLTGPGISLESGIGTFRDSDEIWDKHPIDDVATPHGWRRNPMLVLDFYNQRRKQLLNVEPNEGHIALAELEKNYTVDIITQNVDNLHERAGSSSILHLHGELMKVRSTGPNAEVFNLEHNNHEINLGHKCPKGFQLRPHIVWFGEKATEIDKAIKITQEADIFLIVGSSLNIYPAPRLIDQLKPQTPIYIVDSKDINQSSEYITHLQKNISEGMKIIREDYLKM